jgi:hypothetical protein
MAKSTRKTTTVAISLIMIFAMAIPLATLPSANAQTTQRTYPFVDATPNPVGVGEEVLVRFGISQQLGRVDFGWEGLTVTIVTPSGDTIELDNDGDGFKTDSTGGTATVWVPDEVGTYELTANFPEQTNPYGYYDYERGTVFAEGTLMEASTSETLELVVTEEPNVPYPDQPLPAEYWTRPIDPQLRIWALVAGNWRERERNSIAYYNDDAPETAHVLWAKDLTTGGLTGGLWTDVTASSETGDAYEGKWSGSIILNGILYYQESDVNLAADTVGVDLHTGEEVFRMEGTTYSFGMILYFNSFNYDGVFTYLVSTSGSTYNFYDPVDGQWQFALSNVPSGTRTWGPSGEILIYVIDYNNGRLLRWNSTKAGHEHLGTTADSSWGSWGAQVNGGTWLANGSRCYDFNVSIPTDLQASSSFFTPILVAYPDRVMSLYFNQSGVRVWALDIDGLDADSTSTSKLFDEWWNGPDEWEDGSNTLHYTGATEEVEGGVIAMWSKELRRHYGFSTETGEYLWTTESEHYLDWYGWGNAEHTWYFYEDHLYSVGVGGILYAYDLETGETDWTYELDDAYNEPVTGVRWWGWITLIADGKVYLGTCEHSAEQPLPRGAPLACINASNGAEIWRVNGMYRATRWGGNAVMGDSIYATMDTYDQRVYAVGKGPSATTVSIADNVITEGDSVMVTGWVTDISPGTEEYALTARFPNGVPAVCDDNMSEWMLYVYKQFAQPADVLGVDVTISVLDPNGNYYEVATTTSDDSGFYKAMFTPPVPGEYTVYAMFTGSDAYYGSSSETAVGVLQAPAETPAPTASPTPLADIYILPATIGIIVAVVVIGLVIILMLRKR